MPARRNTKEPREHRRPPPDGRLLYTGRGAALRLGVRRDTIAQMLRAGALRAVPWRGRLRIPAAELERVAREGWLDGPAPPAPRVSRRRIACANPGALRRTRVEDL